MLSKGVNVSDCVTGCCHCVCVCVLVSKKVIKISPSKKDLGLIIIRLGSVINSFFPKGFYWDGCYKEVFSGTVFVDV